MAYLMRYLGYTIDQAEAAVVSKVPTAAANDGFRLQLEQYLTNVYNIIHRT
jgi:hypothetical protein